jgi:hypothetical protein
MADAKRKTQQKKARAKRKEEACLKETHTYKHHTTTRLLH